MLDHNRPSINAMHYGSDSLPYFGNMIWQLVPQHIKDIDNLKQFKLKKWAPEVCPCRLCQVFIGGVGYTNITE